MARIHTAAARVEELQATLIEHADGRFEVRIQSRRIELAELPVAWDRISWQCQGHWLENGPRCAGPLRMGTQPAGRLVLELAATRLAADWRQGDRHLRLQGGQGHWRVDLARLPVVWLDALAKRAWPEGRLVSGEFGGRVDWQDAPAGPRIDAALSIRDLGLESHDARIATAGLAAEWTLRHRQQRGGASIASVDGRLLRGELLFTPLYLAVPEAGIDFDFAAHLLPDAAWRIEDLRWQDSEVLQLSGQIQGRFGQGFESLRLQAHSRDLAGLGSRYLEGLLAPAGWGGLALSGNAQLELGLDTGGWKDFALQLQEAAVVDPRQRLVLTGLAGDLRWSREDRVKDSAIGWRTATLYGIDAAAAVLPFRSHPMGLDLREPTAIGLLDGRMQLQRLAWRPARGDSPLRLDFGFDLMDLDLGLLSRYLDWPAFEGRIDGSLPNATYQNDRLVFDGGLQVSLFGGRIDLQHLVLERPFGVAPSLSGDLRFEDIDLRPLTSAFGFGEITGRLDGRIAELRLVDWSPVAFDAHLQTDREAAGRRRISQRAVQDITDLGGRGLMVGLQVQLLRAFDDFGYDQIGIGCVLRAGVCSMRGIKDRGEGFVIVSGAGLPRIEVIGYRREVDWATLVERLRAAADGGGVRID